MLAPISLALANLLVLRRQRPHSECNAFSLGPDEPLVLKQALTLPYWKDFEKTMRVKCPPKEAIEFDRWVQSQLSSMDFGTRKFISCSPQCLRMVPLEHAFSESFKGHKSVTKVSGIKK